MEEYLPKRGPIAELVFYTSYTQRKNGSNWLGSLPYQRWINPEAPHVF